MTEQGIVFTPMFCPETGKLEKQTVVKQREDGVTLKCAGCGKEHSHEIGYFA